MNNHIPKRKVAVSESSPFLNQNHQLYAKPPGTPNIKYNQFGWERVKLAMHVQNQLDSHTQDNDILERFRREAEQLKKKKFQSKRRQYHQNSNSTIKDVSKVVSHLAPQTIEQFQEAKENTNAQYYQPPPKEELFPQIPTLRNNSNEEFLKQKLKKKKKQLRAAYDRIRSMEQRLKFVERKHHFQEDRRKNQQMQKISELLRELSVKVEKNSKYLDQNLKDLKEIRQNQKDEVIQKSIVNSIRNSELPQVSIKRERNSSKLFVNPFKYNRQKLPSVYYSNSKLHQDNTSSFVFNQSHKIQNSRHKNIGIHL